MCGGTAHRRPESWQPDGLSPRVRGNPEQLKLQVLPRGTIPACAGEPVAVTVVILVAPDYPRVCGGTILAAWVSVFVQGLSPRVRGNPSRPTPGAVSAGTIPACAGEPAPTQPQKPVRRDYPRVCGGTAIRAIIASCAPGLSPRVRGNHSLVFSAAVKGGTIPACAGEPHPPGGVRTVP